MGSKKKTEEKYYAYQVYYQNWDECKLMETWGDPPEHKHYLYYPTKEMAENVANVLRQINTDPHKEYFVGCYALWEEQNINWFKHLPERRIFKGKSVYSTMWISRFVLAVGDYVENEYVEAVRETATVSADNIVQEGDPVAQKVDDGGFVRGVFATYKRVDAETWEYCGLCFKGDSQEKGKFISHFDARW